jgi:transposase
LALVHVFGQLRVPHLLLFAPAEKESPGRFVRPSDRGRSDPICFSPYLYRARNLVERFFHKIKHCRQVATRYDKLAANYLAFVQFASIRSWLR